MNADQPARNPRRAHPLLRAATLSCLALALWTPAAHAVNGMAVAAKLAPIAEMLIPDLRLEWPPGGDDIGLVLALPVHVWSHASKPRGGIILSSSLFVEPQYGVGPDALRLLAGNRSGIFYEEGPGVIIEAGGLAGMDGHGGFVGGGVSWGSEMTPGGWISLVVRQNMLTTEWRSDVSVDITLNFLLR